jgi:hypothetical protein
MPRYTFADDLPRKPPSIWDADTIKAWALEFFCGTLRNRDVAREPTWMYSRRSRKEFPMAAPLLGQYSTRPLLEVEKGFSVVVESGGEVFDRALAQIGHAL